MSVQIAIECLEVQVIGVTIGQYVYYDDGTKIWRRGVRSTYQVLDVADDATGFSGVENTNWHNVRKIK